MRWSSLRSLPRFVLFAAASLATRAVLLGVPTVDLDEAVYLTGAREMLRGGMPYVGFADNKPLLVFAYYAAGPLLGDGMTAVRLLTVLLLVPLVAVCASAFFGHDRRGLAAAALFLVWSAALLGRARGGAPRRCSTPRRGCARAAASCSWAPASSATSRATATLRPARGS